MKKAELVKIITTRHKMDAEQVEAVVNEMVAEMASPFVFPAAGDEVGFINDNHCTNNCKEKIAMLNR